MKEKLQAFLASIIFSFWIFVFIPLFLGGCFCPGAGGRSRAWERGRLSCLDAVTGIFGLHLCYLDS